MGPLKLTPMGFQQLDAATLAAAVGLTVPAGANVALLSPVGAAVMWRDDGNAAPTATVGMEIADATLFEYWGNLSQIKFILKSGTPTLNISYYKAAG